MNFEKVQAAINNKTFEGDFRGIPILKYEAVVEGEVPVGLGPLHTQFDGKGFAYSSLFIDSNITKWKLPPWTDEERKDMNKAVLDKVPTHFSTGHLVVAGSDTAHPYGKWLRGDEQTFRRTSRQRRPVAAGIEPANRHQRRQNEDGGRSPTPIRSRISLRSSRSAKSSPMRYYQRMRTRIQTRFGTSRRPV